MSIETDLGIIEQALLDHAPGPLPEHDALCRVYSGWTDQQAKGCNCSVARYTTAREALVRIRSALALGGGFSALCCECGKGWPLGFSGSSSCVQHPGRQQHFPNCP